MIRWHLWVESTIARSGLTAWSTVQNSPRSHSSSLRPIFRPPSPTLRRQFSYLSYHTKCVRLANAYYSPCRPSFIRGGPRARHANDCEQFTVVRAHGNLQKFSTYIVEYSDDSKLVKISFAYIAAKILEEASNTMGRWSRARGDRRTSVGPTVGVHVSANSDPHQLG